MMLGISLKIDVKKIDKERLYKGEKGTYLDATVFVDTNEDKYGNNGMITQSLTKDQRLAGEKGAILGNCKIFMNRSSVQAQGGHGFPAPKDPGPAPTPQPPSFEDGLDGDDIPF